MKILLNRLVLCLLAAVLCFSTPLRADDDDKPKGHLAKGMSKVQVKKLYGDPDGTSHHDDNTERGPTSRTRPRRSSRSRAARR